ncbi:hypothetical protein [Streptomyces sp. NPDC004629]|uniref:hypothetical protein n=1 Tax=Streptomyces sp. NPDC004629 TaxID=3364705 RepID=UPI00367F328B
MRNESPQEHGNTTGVDARIRSLRAELAPLVGAGPDCADCGGGPCVHAATLYSGGTDVDRLHTPADGS